LSKSEASGGALVLVATPIGNLGDLSSRAVEMLTSADHILCEDTRRTRALLSSLGLPGAGRLLAVHEHNEASRCDEVVAWVSAGETVALVSDAGTPLVADPGARIVEAVLDAGLVVSTTPGPSAVVAAISISGFPAERFVFEGFLPRKGPERRARLAQLAADDRASVVYESPRRLLTTLEELASLLDEERRVAVVRELTKIHEEVLRASASSLAEHFAKVEARGEIVIVIEGAAPEDGVSEKVLRVAIAEALASGLSVRDAADSVAAATGAPRRLAYAMALEHPKP